MKKDLVFFLSFLLSIPQLSAQHYTLQSYEGEKVSLWVRVRPDVRGLTVTGPRNTIHVDDFWALDTVWMPNANFLAVQYAVRGGSGLGLDYTVLLAVKGGRLYPVFSANTFTQSVGMGIDDSTTTTIDLRGHRWDNYVLMLTTDARRMDSGRLSARGDRHYGLPLRLDTARMLFYERDERISETFWGVPVGTDDYTRTFFNPGERLPVFALGDDRYYYSMGRWYEAAGDGRREEDSVFTLIGSLPEVRLWNVLVDSLTGHQHGVSLVFVDYSTSWNAGFWKMRVGVDEGRRFVVYGEYRVERKGYGISKVGGPGRRPAAR